MINSMWMKNKLILKIVKTKQMYGCFPKYISKENTK